MKKTLILLLAAGLPAVAPSAFATYGKAYSVNGSVLIEQGGLRAPLFSGQFVTDGNVLSTSPASGVTIVLSNGDRLALGPDTRLRFVSDNEVQLDRGTISGTATVPMGVTGVSGRTTVIGDFSVSLNLAAPTVTVLNSAAGQMTVRQTPVAQSTPQVTYAQQPAPVAIVPPAPQVIYTQPAPVYVQPAPVYYAPDVYYSYPTIGVGLNFGFGRWGYGRWGYGWRR